tara:strand:- start:317 stop:751 length:435 start_codon:yes stop_codon:yes gene_type:complete
MATDYDPSVWGPHYWFVLQTIALTYPTHPNDVSKKKYYDFIQNLPIFIPDKKIGNEFSEMITQFPVTPYLDSRPSFNKWIHFIHNQINIKTGKPEMNMLDSIQKYNDHYNKPEHTLFEIAQRREKIVYIGIVAALVITAYCLSK